MIVPSVYNYTDYRLFLRDFYEANKAQDTHFTHRFIAERVGFQSSGFFTQVLSGQSNISEETADRFSSFLTLKRRERDYFLLMVGFNQAKSHKEKKVLFEKMLSFFKGKPAEVNAQQYEFYDRWYYSVIREAIAFFPVSNNFDRLAKLLTPTITPGQAKKAIAVLQRLGMIKKDTHGVYRRTDRTITTGYEARAVAITNFSLTTLDHAKNALENYPRQNRSVSSLTLSLSEKGQREIEEKLKLFRRELLEVAYRDRNVDRVCQVNFQVFPYTRIKGKSVG
jgi:uncharacterized protein (TIGR02147 family)